MGPGPGLSLEASRAAVTSSSRCALPSSACSGGMLKRKAMAQGYNHDLALQAFVTVEDSQDGRGIVVGRVSQGSH